ncbi:adipocyte plasma membrane-associated protein Hemomucin-like [Diabrotica undecimpunctata]|uniref:adipocyte plasma membrane-associated protein Hemomucin-like n=1 Tax=Diabrotica undecimpunctata TaxID=50387 RepID=UPI003B63D798
MGYIQGILKFLVNRLLELSIVVVIILFIPNLPPYSQFTKSIKLPPPHPLQGSLSLNQKLNNVEIKYQGRLSGPESFSEYDGELYTGLNSGDIVKLTGNHISPIVKTGKPCKAQYEERICGRPLGLKFHKGLLYVADAYYGILSINVNNGKKKVLVSPDQIIDGKKSKWFNGIAVSKNGDIFWTDSSSTFHLENGLFELLSDPSGRLVHYDAKAKTNTVLIDKIHAANGVALSDDEEFVLVSESVTGRILRYYLKGSFKGTYDVFIDRLPGLPDNINSDNAGGFLVALVTPIDDEHPNIMQILQQFPLARKFIGRMLGITQWIFEQINKIYPNDMAKMGVYTVGRIAPLTQLVESSRVTILRISKDGVILDSLHATNKKIRAISEAYIFKKYLYLGSSQEDYVARISLAEIGWKHLNHSKKNQ